MIKKNVFLLLLLAALSTTSFADGTLSWTQSTYDDFFKGTAKGIAVRSDGALELAPGFKAVFTSPSTFLWAVVADADGTVYAASGAPARVYRITPDGKATIIFEPKELQVQALALDPSQKGVLYAATSPDGKVYRISKSATGTTAPTKTEGKDPAEKSSVPVDASYSASVYFDPKTKYIWSLAFDPSGSGKLYIATGDKGEVFVVNKPVENKPEENKPGEGSVFFKSDEAHVRRLMFTKKGELIAGTDGSGLIYRISATGEGFVLFSAAKKEITALASDAEGNIYAAAVGEKRTGAPIGPAMLIISGMPAGNIGFTPPPGAATAAIAPSIPGGSEVYVLAPDGSPKKLWAVKDDIIYALALDTRGRLLAGSGNRGRIVAIEKNGDFTDLVKASATQVTDFAPAPGGLYAVTSNLGKLFLLNSAPDSEGSFESEVLDAHIFSKWGRSETRGEGLYEVFVRSGNVDNPDRNWSPWKKVEFAKTAAVDAPPARFLQWKLVMRPEMRKDSNAMLDSVKFYYLPKNVAPVVEDVAVQTGARINPSSVLRPVNETIMINASGAQSTIPGSAQNPNPLMPHFETPLAAQKDRGSITVRWSAHDDNDDELSYSVYYKGDGETRWKLLKEKITDKFYSWDAGLLPDGGYMLRVVASDAPSHTPEEALTHFKDSQRFEVDNTPPRIDSLVAKSVDGKLNVTLTATDSFSSIQRAEYSLDAGPWQLVEPVGRISDSLNERYDFTVPLTKPAVPDVKMDKAELSIEHVIVVRVFDRFENMGTAKVVAK